MPAPVTGLIFHGIGTPQRALEPGEALYWIDAAFFAQILDLVRAQPDPQAVRLSFDDGNLSDAEIALPLLLDRGLRADFFVLGGRIGQPGSLGLSHIRTLLDAGMGIGSHGMDHRDWTRLDPSALRHEQESSRRLLADLCGQEITAAAIPFGAYNARVLRALRQAGYACVYSSDGGRMNPRAFLRPRTSVRANMTLAMVAEILADRTPALRRLRRRLGMLQRAMW